MNIKEKVLIYPFSKSSYSLLQALLLSDTYEVVKIVTPKAWLFSGNDIGSLANRENFEILTEDNFEDALSSCTTVVIPEFPDRIFDKVFVNIKLALMQKKKVLYLSNKEIPNEESLKDLAIDKHTQFERIAYNVDWNYIINRPKNNKEVLRNIDIPIIGIGELIPTNQADELAILLSAKFKENGYRVKTVTNNIVLGKNTEYHQFPNLNEFDTDKQRVIALNDFYHWLSLLEYPDLIITTVPNGLIQYNEQFDNGFGILPFLLSLAIK